MIIDPQSNMVSPYRTYAYVALALMNHQVIKHSGADNPPSYDYVAAQSSSSLSPHSHYPG
jgi:hypothetical protein